MNQPDKISLTTSLSRRAEARSERGHASSYRISRFRLPSPAVVSILLIAWVLLLRMPSVLIPHELNVDESGILAQGMKYVLDPLPWRSVDGTTSGPVNAYLLSVLLLGFKPSYILLHLTATALVCLHILVAYRTLLNLCSPRVAAVIILPMTLFYALASDSEYLHYSSELLPTLLLAAGFYFLVRWLSMPPESSRRQTLLLFLGALAIGLAPWCKVQAVPIAGALWIPGIAAVLKATPPLSPARSSPVQVLAFCTGGLLPTVLFLIVLALSGTIMHFWYSYVMGNIFYAGRKTLTQTLGDIWGVFRYSRLRSLLLINILLGAFCLAGLKKDGMTPQERERWILGILGLYSAASFFAVLRPSTSFPHYIIFLVHPMTYLAAVLVPRTLRWLGSMRRTPLWMRILAVAVSVTVAIIYFREAIWYGLYVSQTIQEYSSPYTDSNEEVAIAIKRIKEKYTVRSLSIWGWAPGVFVLTGMPPATRDVIGHYLVSPGPLQEYFRKRYVLDLTNKMPDLFIDAVAPGMFTWTVGDAAWSPNAGYESDKELRRFIETNYVLINQLSLEAHSKPVRFFLRRDIRIAPQRIM